MTTTTTPCPTRTPKASRPETPSQAHWWETVTSKYQDRALCRRCAGQAAYGHQVGFGLLAGRPCEACTPVVAAFPIECANGWRRVPDPRGRTPRTYSRPHDGRIS